MITLSPLSSPGGELANRFIQNDRLIGEEFNLVRGADMDEHVLRRLGSLDMVAIAEVNDGHDSLSMDQLDQRIWSAHFAILAELMVGGRSMRRHDPSLGEAIAEADRQERETWNAFDEALTDAHRESLRRAYPALVAALRARHATLKHFVIFFNILSHGDESTATAFGRRATLTSLFVASALIKTTDWDLTRRWFAREINMAEGLLGLASYLRVATHVGFCDRDLTR